MTKQKYRMDYEPEEMRSFNQEDRKSEKIVKKDQWGSDLEFLCSCITLSVGLGNVWRYLNDCRFDSWQCLVSIKISFYSA
jgi:Sodium:neurotransmitter symporter family